MTIIDWVTISGQLNVSEWSFCLILQEEGAFAPYELLCQRDVLPMLYKLEASCEYLLLHICEYCSVQQHETESPT